MRRPACTARLVVLGALGMGFCAYAAFAAARTTAATNIGLIYACTTPLVASLGDRRRPSARGLGSACRHRRLPRAAW